MKKILFILLLLIRGFSQYSIYGVIYDRSDSERLISVNISIPELKIGTITNLDGYYILTGIPDGKHNIVFEYIGYKTVIKELEFSKEKDLRLDLKLESESVSGDLVTVVADAEKKNIEILYDKAVSKIEITAKDINKIPPILEADLNRALQNMPGISSVSDFSTALYIRGGTPDQNLYLIDGAEVYNPDHMFGLFSTFNTDAIKNVELSKGAFSANYGGRLSSVIDIINLDGNRNDFEANVNISILSAKVTVQMPITENSSLSASFRRTYFDQILKSKEIPNYHFYDGHLKMFLDINEHNKLSLSYFGGNDQLDLKLNQNSDASKKLRIDWNNQTLSSKWTHVYNPQLFSNIWFTFSRFKSLFSLYSNFIKETNSINDFSFKTQFEYHPNQQWSFKSGAEHKIVVGDYNQTAPNLLVNVKNKPRYIAGYLSTISKPESGMEIEMGVRVEQYKNQKIYTNVDPRFSFKYRITENQNIKLAAGRYHQFLHKIARTMFIDIWTASNQYQVPSSSHHYVGGYQYRLSDDLHMETEVFYKDYVNVYQFNRFTHNLKPAEIKNDGLILINETKGLFHKGNGNSYGLELMLKKDKGVISGWLAYTFSKTMMTYDGVNSNQSFAPRHDRNHSSNLVLNIEANNFWNLVKGREMSFDENPFYIGLNAVYASGQPLTIPSSFYYFSEDPSNTLLGNLYVKPSKLNAYRLPGYLRMDLSMTYSVKYDHFLTDYQFQIFNIFSRKNVWYIDYNYSDDSNNLNQNIEIQSMFPLIPSLGVVLKF